MPKKIARPSFQSARVVVRVRDSKRTLNWGYRCKLANHVLFITGLKGRTPGAFYRPCLTPKGRTRPSADSIEYDVVQDNLSSYSPRARGSGRKSSSGTIRALAL